MRLLLSCKSDIGPSLHLVFLLSFAKSSAVGSVLYYHLAGVFDIDQSHLQLTICPRHRDLFGIRWRSNKKNCAAPSSWCSRLSTAVKGERGITLSQSRQLFLTTGVLVPVASRKLLKYKMHFFRENLEQL